MRELFILVTCFGCSASASASASELTYSLQSPIVGGNNMMLFQMETQHANAVKQQKAMIKADEAKLLAEEKRTAASTPAAKFAAALESQLYFSLSREVISSINEVPEGKSGQFTTGDTSVVYKNIAGVLHITITSPTGTSTLEVPVL